MNERVCSVWKCLTPWLVLPLIAGCSANRSVLTAYECDDRIEIALQLSSNETANYLLTAETENGRYTCTVQMPQLDMPRDSYRSGECSDPQTMVWTASFPSGGGRMCNADEQGNSECITVETPEAPIYTLVLYGTPQTVTLSAQRAGQTILDAQRLLPSYQSEHGVCTSAALSLTLP